MTTTDAIPAAAQGWERVADALRHDILSGILPPGIRLASRDVKARHGCTIRAARWAMCDLEAEGLLRDLRYGRCWTGTRDPAADTRMGAALARLRQQAGLTTRDLADATGLDHLITDAESGTWCPRNVWQRLDEALGTDGALLHLHDKSYAPRPPGDQHDPQPTPPGEHPPATAAPREHRFTRVTTELRARITAGEWAPGDRLPPITTLARDHDTITTGAKIALADLATEGLLTHRPTKATTAPASTLPGHAPSPRSSSATATALA